MFKKYLTLSALSCALLVSNAHAVLKTDGAITDNLAKYQIQVDSIQPTPIKGVYEVATDNGILYTDANASYFIHGQLFQTTAQGIVNLTEKSKAKHNLALLKNANVEDEYVVYPAKNEKHVITIFTDTTCGYCRKLHSEIQSYNDAGITVRYLAFPRSGERSPNIKQMAAIWCAKDKQAAMTQAKTGKFQQESTKCTDMVMRHMKLGNQMGVEGTPAILLENGSMVGGYLPAAKLLERIEQAG